MRSVSTGRAASLEGGPSVACGGGRAVTNVDLTPRRDEWNPRGNIPQTFSPKEGSGMDRLRPVRWVLAIALVATTIQASFAPVASAGASGTFLVVYKGTAVPSTAEARIQAAGGSLVYSYPQIGVAVATSDDALFGTTLRSSDSSVQGAVATAKFGTQLSDPGATSDTGEQAIDPGTPAPGDDSLSGLQWDMDQIHAPEARAITGGSPSVVVGDIDTGLDYTHPDLAANVDFANSVSCVERRAEHGSGGMDRRQRSRHAHRRHDRRGDERHRHRRRGAEREDRRHQGRQRRRASSSPRPWSARSCGPALTTSR